MDTQPETLSSRLAALLNLNPAEGATVVTDDEVIARVTALIAEAGSAATAATDLATAQADLEKVRGEYQALYQREEDARKKVEEAAADEILAQYADRIATPEAKARIRALLLTDREAAMEILKGLAAPAPKAAEEQPPKPLHDPDSEATSAQSDEETASKIKSRAQALQSQNPALTWADAWAKAEKEIRAAA